MLKKILCLIIIFFLILPMLSGCYDAKGLEDLAYVIAIGLDQGDTNLLKLTLQFTLLSKEDSESGSSSQSNSSTVVSVECSSIDSGISLINDYISKKINLSHCKALIISEVLAHKGLSEHLFTIVNDIEIRPDCNVIITKCEASDFLNYSLPTLNITSAEYYELIFNSSQYTGYTENVTISDFYSNILSTDTQSYAILGGINTFESHLDDLDSSYTLDDDYVPNKVPIIDSPRLENIGIAVFNGDKLVGELNGVETICHMILNGKLEKATITIPSPFINTGDIDLYISLSKKSENNVELINNYPYINCTAHIVANILTLNKNLDLLDEKNLKLIEESANAYLNNAILSYLYKTSKQYRSDIIGFGKNVRKKYLTWQEWIDSDWLNNYQNAFFNVTVYTTIENSYLFNNFT